MKKGRVSVIIPTKNSAVFLENCLRSVRAQTYKDIEIILVDGNSTDDTRVIARQYGAHVYTYNPKVPRGYFDAPYRRNYGAKKANGEFIYIIDADMELTPKVIKNCVDLCKKGADAVIVSEDSFGEGIWARAKNLERRCYWGDKTIEAPRFVKASVWKRLGGLDTSLGGGGDDWDLAVALQEGGFVTQWSTEILRHNEGALTLSKLFGKRYMYGRDSLLYLAKRPKAATRSYFPIRMAYIRNWRLFLHHPVDTLAFIIMRTVEYAAGLLGILTATLRKS